MKRILIILCIIVGGFTLVEFIVPGHLNLFLAYMTGIGNLFNSTYGTPVIQQP